MRVAALFAAALYLTPAAGGAAETLRVPRISAGMIEARVEPSRLGRPGPAVIVVGDTCSNDAFGPAFDAPSGVAALELPLNCLQGGPDLGGTVLDVLTVARDLRVNAGWWNGRLYLVGAGEGAAAASAAAGLLSEVEGVALIDAAPAAANGAPRAPLLLVNTGAADAGAERLARDSERISYRRVADAYAALAEAARWLRRQEAARVAQPQQAEAPPPPAAPRKTSRADARPRPARAPTIVLAPAVTAPKAAPRRPALRGALPAAPGPRRGTGRPAPR